MVERHRKRRLFSITMVALVCERIANPGILVGSKMRATGGRSKPGFGRGMIRC